jgi:streptogramin lyase
VVSETYGFGSSGTSGVSGITSFNQPYRIAVDSTGDIFVADTVNNRIRRITFSTGYVSVTAGGGSNTDTSSGTATSKLLNRPNGVAVYGSIVYFTNTGANTVCKVQGGIISNLPGSYSAPEGIAVDSAGNLYVANTAFNNIIKVTAGNDASVINLPADTTLNAPRGVAVDSTGRIYIADGGNNRVIRLNTDSTVTLVAQGLNIPMDVSVDTDGTVYIADFGNNKIIKVRVTFV